MPSGSIEPRAVAPGHVARTWRHGFALADRRRPGIRIGGSGCRRMRGWRKSEPGGRVCSGDLGHGSDGVPGGIPPGLFGFAGRTRQGWVDGRPVAADRSASIGRRMPARSVRSADGRRQVMIVRPTVVGRAVGSVAAGIVADHPRQGPGKSGSGGRDETLGLWIVRSDGVPGSIPPGRPPCRADPAGACRWSDRPGGRPSRRMPAVSFCGPADRDRPAGDCRRCRSMGRPIGIGRPGHSVVASISRTQWSAAERPSMKAPIVSNTASEKPPTLRMSGRSTACVVALGCRSMHTSLASLL